MIHPAEVTHTFNSPLSIPTLLSCPAWAGGGPRGRGQLKGLRWVTGPFLFSVSPLLPQLF